MLEMEICNAVLEALKDAEYEGAETDIVLRQQIFDAFGEHCANAGLLAADGTFADMYKLAKFLIRA